MPVIRTLTEVLGLPDLTWAEKKLLNECGGGDWVRIGDERPASDGSHRRIRADILRYLALGGCPGLRPHEKGLLITGAAIPDVLDLEGGRIGRDLCFHDCVFQNRLILRGAVSQSISLAGTHCDGIVGDRLVARGGLSLSAGFRANGLVSLSGAEIGGNLECDDGAFLSGGEIAVNADRLKTTGSVFFRDGFRAEGEVRLVGAEIGGNLACVRSTFLNDGGTALNADSVRISGAFFWRSGAFATGRIDLSGARCGQLNDDRACWPTKRGDLMLDGFVYGAISGGPVDAATRLEWLALCDARHFNEDFWPQPYEQLAKALREMGHVDDARTVLVEKERLQREDFRRRRLRWIEAVETAREINSTAPDRSEMADGDTERFYQRQSHLESDLQQREHLRAHARPGGDSDSRKARAGLDPDSRAMAARARRNDLRMVVLGARLRILASHVFQRAFDWTVGFGHRPFRAIYLLFALVILGSFLFSQVWRAGQFAPNAAVILLSDDWAAAQAQPNPAAHWARQSKAGRDYETYYSGAYAFDVVVPLIDLGQEAAWAPSTAGGRWSWGWWGWWLRWFLKTLGWIVSALGAAAITGIIRRE